VSSARGTFSPAELAVTDEVRKALLRLLPGVSLSLSPNYDSNSFLVNHEWVSVTARFGAYVNSLLIAPVLIAFVLLTVDVGRAYWQAIDAAGAARAGARMGIISDTSDIGSAVRDEPNTGIPNTAAAWGSEGPGTAWRDPRL